MTEPVPIHKGDTILLTGASGFIGRALWPALVARGYRVRCLTRDVQKARAALGRSGRDPHEWVEGDIADPAAMDRALRGCRALYYLVHEMSEEHGDFQAREREEAAVVARAAEHAGLARIVYLGGVAPRQRGSKHLRSRLEVGEILRRGPVPAIELRASMIVGHGSQSWLMVRDLAARLPVMVLPRWLRARTEPVAVSDVVVALAAALTLPIENEPNEKDGQAPSARGACFDIPGPEVLSGEEILKQTAEALGRPRPQTLSFPLMSSYLSSLWMRLVTRARWSVARELVQGLTQDLLARDDRYWQRIGHPHRMRFADAAAAAIAAEKSEGPVPGPWGLVERGLGTLAQAARLVRAVRTYRDAPKTPPTHGATPPPQVPTE